jgi:hypothetical protein
MRKPSRDGCSGPYYMYLYYNSFAEFAESTSPPVFSLLCAHPHEWGRLAVKMRQIPVYIQSTCFMALDSSVQPPRSHPPSQAVNAGFLVLVPLDEWYTQWRISIGFPSAEIILIAWACEVCLTSRDIMKHYACASRASKACWIRRAEMIFFTGPKTLIGNILKHGSFTFC